MSIGPTVATLQQKSVSDHAELIGIVFNGLTAGEHCTRLILKAQSVTASVVDRSAKPQLHDQGYAKSNHRNVIEGA